MEKRKQQFKRKLRVRAKLRVTKERPRLVVFRSNRYTYAQVIDHRGHTLLGVSEKEMQESKEKEKVARAKQVGLLLAKKALQKRIKSVVFDKRSYAFAGRVKAVAYGAREGGLKF